MSQAKLALAGLGLLAAAVAAAWELGRRDGLADGLAVERAAVVDTIRIVERHYHHDTARFYRERTKWDTVMARVTTVEPYLIRDTVWVKEALAQADTTIKLCNRALLTCEQVVGLQRRRAELAEQEITVLRGRIPTRREQVATHLIAAAGGLAFGLLAR